MQKIIDTYKTFSIHSEGYYRNKGSKFYAHAYPVNNEDEIKILLTNIKKKYYDATHYCYAYRLGVDKNEKYRMNDDGEPSNSSGKPIYGQILSNNLTNVIIVVVRYFGGIKLGVPGLILAYKSASADAIKNNTIINKIITTEAVITCKYQNINTVMKLIKDEALEIISQDYIDNEILITVLIRNSMLDYIFNKVNSIYEVKINL